MFVPLKRIVPWIPLVSTRIFSSNVGRLQVGQELVHFLVLARSVIRLNLYTGSLIQNYLLPVPENVALWNKGHRPDTSDEFLKQSVLIVVSLLKSYFLDFLSDVPFEVYIRESQVGSRIDVVESFDGGLK